MEESKNALSNVASSPEPVMILNLKSMSRKKIKRLRKGKGRAMGKVAATLEEFKANGDVPAGAQVVIAIVKQKKRKKSSFMY